jgi:hypothetical protein
MAVEEEEEVAGERRWRFSEISKVIEPLFTDIFLLLEWTHLVCVSPTDCDGSFPEIKQSH